MVIKRDEQDHRGSSLRGDTQQVFWALSEKWSSSLCMILSWLVLAHNNLFSTIVHWKTFVFYQWINELGIFEKGSLHAYLLLCKTSDRLFSFVHGCCNCMNLTHEGKDREHTLWIHIKQTLLHGEILIPYQEL